jgi:hypothetical protein
LRAALTTLGARRDGGIARSAAVFLLVLYARAGRQVTVGGQTACHRLYLPHWNAEPPMLAVAEVLRQCQGDSIATASEERHPTV